MQPAPLTGTATPHRGWWYSGCPGRCSLHPSRGRLLPGQWNTGRIRSGPRRKRPYRHPYDTPPCKGAAASFPDQICPQAVRVGRSEGLRSKDTFRVYASPLVPRPGCRRTAFAVRRFYPPRRGYPSGPAGRSAAVPFLQQRAEDAEGAAAASAQKAAAHMVHLLSPSPASRTVRSLPRRTALCTAGSSGGAGCGFEWQRPAPPPAPAGAAVPSGRRTPSAG